MTNAEFAKSHLTSAMEIVKEAEALLKRKVWHLVVRRAQEVVELSLKALLRQVGIEIPRVHDVGVLLAGHAERFGHLPIDRLVSISRRLRVERELSFYGDEETESPPEKLYTSQDAERALEDAHFVLSLSQEQIQKE